MLCPHIWECGAKGVKLIGEWLVQSLTGCYILVFLSQVEARLLVVWRCSREGEDCCEYLRLFFPFLRSGAVLLVDLVTGLFLGGNGIRLQHWRRNRDNVKVPKVLIDPKTSEIGTTYCCCWRRCMISMHWYVHMHAPGIMRHLRCI